MYRKEDEIKDSLEKFFQAMVAIAKEDDVITDEELNILNTIQDGIDNLEQQLIEILQSELTEAEFRDIEQQIFQDIIFNTTKVAEEDDVLTDDETKLLDKLKEFSERGVIE